MRATSHETCSDGLRWADEDNDEIRGWTDRNTMIKRRVHWQPHSPTGRPALLREAKRGGIRFDSQKCGSATDNAEQNVWSNYD